MDSKVTKFEKNMSAVAFAEAGEFDTATEFLQEEKAEASEVNPAIRKKPYAGMALFGAISLSGYITLMTHQGWVSEEYTMGGWHAAYPVMTALAFSFIHGAFASKLLSVLGIEAKK